jgi:hypothetical protein
MRHSGILRTLGVGACATVFSCGGRTQSSDATWSAEGLGDLSTSSSAPAPLAPGINQPSPRPPVNTPSTPPAWTEPGRTDPPSPTPWPEPTTPVHFPTDCAGFYELVLPEPFTYGPHANNIDVKPDVATSQWCFSIPPETHSQVYSLQGSGFGLTFGSISPSGRQAPFDLALRGANSVHFTVHTTEYLLRASVVEARPINDLQGEAFTATQILNQGANGIPMSEFTRLDSGDTVRLDRFYALQFEFVSVTPHDDTVCIGDLVFLDACGSITVEAEVDWDWVPAPAPTATQDTTSTSLPPEEPTTDNSWNETSTTTDPFTDVPSWPLDAGISATGPVDDLSSTDAL